MKPSLRDTNNSLFALIRINIILNSSDIKERAMTVNVNNAEELVYSSESGILPTPVLLDPCGKPSDAENFRMTDEDGACDDGVN